MSTFVSSRVKRFRDEEANKKLGLAAADECLPEEECNLEFLIELGRGDDNTLLSSHLVSFCCGVLCDIVLVVLPREVIYNVPVNPFKSTQYSSSLPLTLLLLPRLLLFAVKLMPFCDFGKHQQLLVM